MNSYERFFSRAALARKPSPIRVLTKIQVQIISRFEAFFNLNRF
jgi:hypothetical protein